MQNSTNVSSQMKVKHIPYRMCVICRQKISKHKLDRYTCPSPGNREMSADPDQKGQGRGFYVCRSPQCQKKMPRFKGWQKKCKGGRDD